MQTISSAAGTRLARAKAALDAAREDEGVYGPGRRLMTLIEFKEAAEAVADELIEQGFADMEGE